MIELWSSREPLFNAQHPSYADKNIRDNILTEIATEMNIPKEALVKKMVSLKSYFGSIRSKVDASQKSGAGADEAYQPTWPYYEPLQFLRDNIAPRRTVDNRKTKSITELNSTKSQSLNDSINESNSLIKSAISVIGKKKTEEEDEDAIFGELIASQMRKIEDSFMKDELKIEIQDLILRKRREINDSL